jgi:RNA binding exosome subunit
MTLDELGKKMREIELRVDELESQQENIEDSLKKQLGENDIRAIVDRLFDEQDNATKRDVDLELNKQQLLIIKWVIGTGISVIAIIITFVRFFLL